MKRILYVLLAVLMLMGLFASCKQTNDPSPPPSSPDNSTSAPPKPSETGSSPSPVETDPGWDSNVDYDEYVPPPSDTAAEITIMMWAGDGSYMKDIGNLNLTPEDLRGRNQAAAYATAKAFKEVYPNIKINVYAKEGDPNTDGISWAQRIENFRAEYGAYPDIYVTMDVVADVQKGMCADISVFENDPVYRSFNKGVLMLSNINGKQFALPKYLLPWGIYVNKSLAEANNIDVPGPDWTIDQYTEFVTHSDPSAPWYGAMDAPLNLFQTGSKDFSYNLTHRTDGSYVNLASDSFLRLLEYIPRWASHAVWPQNDLGNTPEGFMDENWWWGARFFQQNRLLTLGDDPWMMGDIAHPDPEFYLSATMADWDIYPRPSTSELGNTVGVVFDPLAIHNFSADPNLSEEEAYSKLQLAYEFAKFWCADTRAWRARAEQLWLDGDSLNTAMDDSLPMVTGAAFNEQMQIWYSSLTHQRFADKNKMPGWHRIIELWEGGQIWDISDKAYPWRFERDGSIHDILEEYFNCWNPEIVGASRTDANWLDQMKALLPDWNRTFNERFAAEFATLENSINRYYS